ncbi:unnamed protein product [Amoebophrya sp. A25]|nr:unnamed protein product [Amoebophrya sp. A25]|eukprot:GSA25T00005060001.1
MIRTIASLLCRLCGRLWSLWVRLVLKNQLVTGVLIFFTALCVFSVAALLLFWFGYVVLVPGDLVLPLHLEYFRRSPRPEDAIACARFGLLDREEAFVGDAWIADSSALREQAVSRGAVPDPRPHLHGAATSGPTASYTTTSETVIPGPTPGANGARKTAATSHTKAASDKDSGGHARQSVSGEDGYRDSTSMPSAASLMSFFFSPGGGGGAGSGSSTGSSHSAFPRMPQAISTAQVATAEEDFYEQGFERSVFSTSRSSFLRFSGRTLTKAKSIFRLRLAGKLPSLPSVRRWNENLGPVSAILSVQRNNEDVTQEQEGAGIIDESDGSCRNGSADTTPSSGDEHADDSVGSGAVIIDDLSSQVTQEAGAVTGIVIDAEGNMDKADRSDSSTNQKCNWRKTREPPSGSPKKTTSPMPEVLYQLVSRRSFFVPAVSEYSFLEETFLKPIQRLVTRLLHVEADAFWDSDFHVTLADNLSVRTVSADERLELCLSPGVMIDNTFLVVEPELQGLKKYIRSYPYLFAFLALIGAVLIGFATTVFLFVVTSMLAVDEEDMPADLPEDGAEVNDDEGDAGGRGGMNGSPSVAESDRSPVRHYGDAGPVSDASSYSQRRSVSPGSESRHFRRKDEARSAAATAVRSNFRHEDQAGEDASISIGSPNTSPPKNFTSLRRRRDETSGDGGLGDLWDEHSEAPSSAGTPLSSDARLHRRKTRRAGKRTRKWKEERRSEVAGPNEDCGDSPTSQQ